MKPLLAKLACAAGAATLLVAAAATAWASSAAPAPLPWDAPLMRIADYLTNIAGPLTVKLAASGALVLFAVSGGGETTRLLARMAVGAGVALLAVYLLNYLLPA